MIDRRLQVLRTVAARGTVTAAAEALGYTPSAVSHQLSALSRELGVRLLEPDGRGVRLTLAARVLLEGADDLTARAEEIRAELAAASGEHGGSLTLCGFSTPAAVLLPKVAVRLRESYPYGTVRILEANPADCFDLLLTEHADVAVVVATSSMPARTDRRFEQESLLDDPLDLLVPADHRLAQQSSVALREAATENWIMDRRGTPYRDLVMAACAYAGFTPSVAHQSMEWDTGAALVGAGLGVALIPRLSRLPDDPRIRRVPLSGEPAPARHILTAIRRGSRRQPAIASALTELNELAAVITSAITGESGVPEPS